MFERAEIALKIACLAFGALLLFQLLGMVTCKDPLANVNLAALSALAANTNAPTNGKGTNAPLRSQPETNSAPPQSAARTQTNSDPAQASANSQTKSAQQQVSATNSTNNVVAQPAEKISTNSVAKPGAEKSKTNASPSAETPEIPTASVSEHGSSDPPRASTNRSAASREIRASTKPPSMPTPSMARMGPGMGAGAAPELPPAIRARVDRIYQSEIFGPIIRPQPVALIGIAGKDVFLRAPSGQTGLVREGEELGGIKLIRIGTNRVLVEEDGQKKELTLFSGFGGETLLPTGKEK